MIYISSKASKSCWKSGSFRIQPTKLQIWEKYQGKFSTRWRLFLANGTKTSRALSVYRFAYIRDFHCLFQAFSFSIKLFASRLVGCMCENFLSFSRHTATATLRNGKILSLTILHTQYYIIIDQNVGLFRGKKAVPWRHLTFPWCTNLSSQIEMCIFF
jgi:hypothetical protein